MAGKLFIVGTPIGNLEDLSARAVRVLKEVNLIAAEDTRHTGILLKHLEISCRQVSYHKFNEAKRKDEILSYLKNGENVALVSDAGMPGISDPGERLIHECLYHDLDVEVIPGPSAVLHALVASGLKMTPFYFGGFLPVKGGQRQKELHRAEQRECTSVYFESPHRILRTLEESVSIFEEQRKICVARELTKKFEEVKTGSAAEILDYFKSGKVRGEITFLVQGASAYTKRMVAQKESH
ncbi:MAG: 16S rRNA (cytidine(1402)-2'-O)-methyltransferase [Verrucomicrobiota bacterium]